ncbi:glycine cleavage system protein R [Psychrobium sp. 1_MG-2023]|uniref:glycine cleavage system protein R n=1 Tax=Psychrobium sp. 1_MG-2023 TaxID=3062624 RepID=UPI000C34E657|nr:ACT domain-containing protein [Psychrobium sp. 1_MG-2023]MDP2560914.1 ACT domain-containing protein [Psychrobium sp. 1_MG-2023]PKF55988.1 glycine cleavage system protein R [Alteromonadales bacterium alter-6D02]
MKNIVVTFIGKDKAGLADQLAQLIYQHQGNWLGSSMSHLAGQFAGIIQVELPELELAKFSLALGQLDDLNTVIQEGHNTAHELEAEDLLNIAIVCNDRQGIVQEVTKALHSVDANIEQLGSQLESAPNSGHLLFRANVTALLPEHSSIEQLQEAIENLGDDVMVDIEYGC